MKDLTVRTISYSNDGQLVMIVGDNKYLFKNVNPFQKKKLEQYSKHNNKKSFFNLLRTFEYEKLATRKKNKGGSADNNGDKRNNNESGDGEQLSLFEVRNVIKEEINNILQESRVLKHFEERVMDRLKGDNTYPPFPYEKVKDNIDFLKKVEFPGQYNIGIKIFSSKQPYHYKNVVDGKEEESYGSNVWVVVRANELETLFFMRDGEIPRNTQYQVTFDYLKEVVDNKGSYEIEVEDLKEKPKKKRSRKGDLNLPTVDIKGKEWYIDKDNNQLIYSKNTKKTFPLDQALEELPEEVGEKILAYI